MSDYHISSPLDKEVLALYHAHALSDSESTLVKNLLTEEDHIFLQKLDHTIHSLHTYKNAELRPCDAAYQRISTRIAQLPPSESSAPISFLSRKFSGKSSRSFRVVASAVTLVAAACASFFGYKLLYPPHSTHPAHVAITLPMSDTDVFPVDKHNRAISGTTYSLFEQAASCITGLTHHDYTVHQIIAVSPQHNNQTSSNIIVRLPEPGRALRITTSTQCLTHPHMHYTYTSAVITF